MLIAAGVDACQGWTPRVLLFRVPSRFSETVGFSRLRRLASIRVVRFACVGVVVTLFFMGLNKAFSQALGWGVQSAFLASYPPALALHFGLNKWWTFADRRSTSARHVGDYLFSVVATFLIQWPAFTALHSIFHLSGWVAAGGANAIQMAASYLLLRQRVFKEEATEGSAASRLSWHRLAWLLACVGISALLAWTSLGAWSLPKLGPKQYDYFNYLVSGFRKGSLALDVVVPPELIASKNPYDPAERPAGIAPHDVSYYKGRYYLYFGVVPVVTLFWPFRIVAGCDLSMTYAAIAYGIGAFFLAAWLWMRVLRDYFPNASLTTKLSGLLALGIAGGQLVVARRTSFWEIPIEAGYFHMLCTVGASYLALESKRPLRWLGIAGLSLGLAIGCRPTLIGAGAALALVVALTALRLCSGTAGATRLRRGALVVLAAGIPFAVVLTALLGYNLARFGNPLEFGIRYQLTASEDQTKIRRFSASYILFNLRTYFLSAPQWGRYFPFLHPARDLARPNSYYGVEFTYGALAVCPVVWLCGLFPAWIVRLRDRGPFPMACFFLLAASGTTGLLVCFNTAAGRYVLDFLPWWIWLAVLGVALWERELMSRGRRVAAGAVASAFAVVAFYSALVAFFQSADIHGIFKFENPHAYVTISRWFDLPAALWERASGEKLGALEMDVVFPESKAGTMAPLVVTGVGYETDYVFVYFRTADRVQLGYLSSGGRPLFGDEIMVFPGKKYHLRLEEGSLLPPAGHPIYDGWRESELRSVKNWVTIALDGRQVLKMSGQSHEASPGSLQIGHDANSGACGRRFGGAISNFRRDPLQRPRNGDNGAGDVCLDITFPTEPDAQVQPLVVVGKTGLADLIGMRMADKGHFTVYYESWGGGIGESGPIPIPRGNDATLRIRMGSLCRDGDDPVGSALGDSIVVWLDGKPVWWAKELRDVGPGPALDIGVNAIESSAMIPYFKGRIRGWSRGPMPAAWRRGPFGALELELGGCGSGSEPLVTTGQSGRADTLAVEWLPLDRARLIYDHWGIGEIRSAPFALDCALMHTIRVAMPSFSVLDKDRATDSSAGRVRVEIDGRNIWDAAVQFYGARSETLAIGRNTVGSTVAGLRLSCVVANLRQIELDSSPPAQ
jgi:putative flippase GtrA